MTTVRPLFSPRFPSGTDDLEDLYEHAPCGYLSLEPGGRIDRVNATFLAWTGYSHEELLGRNFQNLLNIAGKIFYETHFAPLLRLQGSFSEVALDLVARDGMPIPVLVNAAERRDATGKTTFIRITVFNATDRRRYERELLAARNTLAETNQKLHDLNEEVSATNLRLDLANRELRAFYETLPVGIFRTDELGKIVQASRSFCTLLGIQAAEHWSTTIASKDRSDIMRQWEGAIRNGHSFSSRFQVGGDLDAALRCIEMKAVPIAQAEGGASAFVGMIEDVSEQVRIEGQKRQIDRDAAVRQLTGGFAHNLNGILTVIMGNLEILEDDLADRPQSRTVVEGGLVATQRASALVSRLLLYSGYTFTRLENLEIDPCLKAVAKSMVDRIGKPHRLTCDFRARGALVPLDNDMLKEALEELILNAAAAMPDGGEIRISTKLSMRSDSSDRGDIVIAVSDHGIGMDHATLAKAREPFFTRRDVGEGMGLGLSLVDGIARIAGGELRLHSDEGNGTTVEMHLPAVL